MRTRALEDGVVPGTNLGVGFTASIAEKSIIPEGGERFLREFVLSYKGDGATAAVNFEDFLGLVNPFTFKANETRINLRGRDIFALNAAWYGNVPWFRQGTAATDDQKTGGMRIPINVLPGRDSLAYSITRSAVTNISGEVLRLTLRSFQNIPDPVPPRYDIKEISITNPGSTGLATLIEQLPRIGRLEGLLVFLTTVPTDTADTASIQRLFLESPRGRFADLHVLDMLGSFTEYYGEIAEGVVQEVLANYGWVELREEPIDLVNDQVSVKADVGVASEAVRVIPVIGMAQSPG